MIDTGALDFSVVIPTWNRPALLQRAVQSALKQRGVAVEIIVVEDGDGSGARAVASLPVRTAHTGCDGSARGQVPARNLGVARARGRWIAFLDDDDWWDDGECLAAFAQVLATADCITYGSGQMVFEDEAGTPTGAALPFVAQASAQSLRQDNTLLVSSLAFPRAFTDRFGGFDESLPHYWDWDWYLRLTAGGVSLVPAATSAARISARAGSVSSSENEAARRAELDRLAFKHRLGPLRLRNHASIARDRAMNG